MKKAYRELRRRPLLTPIWLAAIFGLLFIAALAWFVSSMTTTTVVVVRHAEKELGSIEDPPLSMLGEQRAQLLARLFGERAAAGRLAAVFALDARVTRSTASPLAARLGLSVSSAVNVEQLLEKIHRDYRGQAVLVVGHAATVPEVLRRLGRDDVPPMGEQEYSTMYVITVPTVGDASLLRMNY